MSGLYVHPKITTLAPGEAKESTLSATNLGIESLMARDSAISRAKSGAAVTINHGSTAKQWPPTPGLGEWRFTRGCLLAYRITSHTLAPRRSQIFANSLTRAIFTSRKVFSINLHNSAVSESVTNISP